MAEGSFVRELLDVFVTVAREGELGDVLRRILEVGCDALDAPWAAISLHDPESSLIEVSRGSPPPRPTPEAVPIRVRDQESGTLQVAARGSADHDREMIETLAVAAGVAIENARVRAVGLRRERWLTASYDVTAALLSGNDPAYALQLIAARARVLADAAVAAVATPIDEEAEHLHFEVVDTAVELSEDLTGLTVPTEGTATGMAFTTKQPVVVRDYGRHATEQQAPADVDLPPQVRQLDSAVAVPLVVEDQALGVLVVAKPVGEVPFTATEVELVQTFAGHAALTLAFARASLDRQRLAVFEDRERIARELHDQVVQRLFSINLGLSGLRPRQRTVAQRVAEFARELDRTIGDLRDSIFTLQAVRPPGSSLQKELLALVENASTALGFEPQLSFDGPIDSAITPDLGVDVLAALAEALSNVTRHAGSTAVSVEVAVDKTGRGVSLVVTDDGSGVPDDVVDRGAGLAAVRERAARWGGQLSVRTRPEGGTRFSWTARIPRASVNESV